MARIKMPVARSKAQEITFEEAFHIFLTDSAARGLAEKTLKTYRNHLHCISLYFDISTPLGKLSRNKIRQIIKSNAIQSNFFLQLLSNEHIIQAQTK